MVNEYQDLIRSGQESFRQEVESLNPGLKMGKRFGQPMFETCIIYYLFCLTLIIKNVMCCDW